LGMAGNSEGISMNDRRSLGYEQENQSRQFATTDSFCLDRFLNARR